MNEWMNDWNKLMAAILDFTGRKKMRSEDECKNKLNASEKISETHLNWGNLLKNPILGLTTSTLGECGTAKVWRIHPKIALVVHLEVEVKTTEPD